MNGGFNFIRNVRNHLHGATQIITTTLFIDHALVNLARREIIRFLHLHGDKALVMAEVKVGFCTVFGDKNLAMLKRRHGARIHVDIRVQLDHRDFNTASFENGGKGGCCDPLAKR